MLPEQAATGSGTRACAAREAWQPAAIMSEFVAATGRLNGARSTLGMSGGARVEPARENVSDLRHPPQFATRQSATLPARLDAPVMLRALFILALAVALPVAAQSPPPNLEPVPEPPPEIGLDTSPTGPAVKIEPGPQDKVEEYSIDGRRYVRVVQPNGHEYYLVESLAQAGLTPSAPGGGGDNISVPQWQLLQF